EKLRKAVARSRPRPGRLRVSSALVITAAVAALGIFWLPDAVMHQTLSALPTVKQSEIGASIVITARRFTGVACSEYSADAALTKIASRIDPGADIQLHVVPDGLTDAVALPGNHYLIGRALVEDFETPEVLIGYILSESLRSGGSIGTVQDVLEGTRFLDNVRLLTTGTLPSDRIAEFAEITLSAERDPRINGELLHKFNEISVSSRPYAFAVDLTGETTLDLIEADPMAAQNPFPILSDGEWVALQGICEN
ncbi:MAG: hypothetical protein P8L32_06035, partial [Paracoccaceae bacterium]|nr:hypothetical protein [Paracoccaceae bacterium]